MTRHNTANIFQKDFHKLTVLNDKVVSIEEVQIQIPIENRTIECDSESLIFKTNNRELIHLSIYQNNLKQSMNFQEWEETLFNTIMKDKNLNDIKKITYRSWNLSFAKLLFLKWKECDERTAKNYIFNEKEKIYDVLAGKKDTELKRFKEILNLRKYHNLNHASE